MKNRVPAVSMIRRLRSGKQDGGLDFTELKGTLDLIGLHLYANFNTDADTYDGNEFGGRCQYCISW